MGLGISKQNVMTYQQIQFHSPVTGGPIDQTPDFTRTLGAIYNLEDPFRSAFLNKAFGLSQGFLGFEDVPQEYDARFDPLEKMMKDGNLNYFRLLHTAKNEEHYDLLKRKADWENNEKETIAQSGIGASLLSGLLVGTVNPLNLGVGLVSGGATTFMGAAFRAVASSVVATGLTETTLRQTQVDRTLEESAMNIMGDMIISTAFGSAFYGVSKAFKITPEHIRRKVVNEYMNGLPFASEAVDAGPQLGIRPQTRWGDRATDHSVRIPPVSAGRAEKSDVVVGGDLPGWRKGDPQPSAWYDEKNHQILIDWERVEADFEAKAWENPTVKGVTPLEDEWFRHNGVLNLERYKDFVRQHEYLHTIHKRLDGETVGAYENRINRYSLLLLQAGSEQGVAFRTISESVHASHAQQILARFEEDTPGVHDQMVMEGAFGSWGASIHPDGTVDGTIAPKQRNSQEAIDVAEKEIGVDPITGYSDEQYFGVMSWTTKLARAVGGLEKLGLNPMLRVASSIFPESRLAGIRLTPTPMNEGNFLGHTTPGDVATASNARQVQIAEALARGEKTFIDYRLGHETGDMPTTFQQMAEYARSQKERGFKENPTDKTRYIKEFRERVSKGLRSGDVDENPIIDKHVKYLRELLDKLTKEAEDLGLFGAADAPLGAMSLMGAKSFLPRVWLQDVLEKNQDDLTNVIMEWQITNKGREDAPEYLAKLIANPKKHKKFVRNQLISVGRKLHSVEDFDIEITDVAGTFKGRSIWVDDMVLAGENTLNKSFLENDINMILRQWMPKMHTDIELVRKFGSVTMEKQFSQIRARAVKDAAENKEKVFSKELEHPGKKQSEDELIREALLEVEGRGGMESDPIVKRFRELAEISEKANKESDPDFGNYMDFRERVRTKYGEEDLDAITKEQLEILATAREKSTPEIVETTKLAEKDIADLSAMRDIMRGTYGLTSDPLAISSRFARMLTDMTHLSLMGNVAVSSIPDAGRILMVNRLEGINALKLAFTDFKRFRQEMKSMARDVGVGLDMSLGTTAQSLFYSGDIPRYTAGERLIGRLTDIQFIVNLLNPWNAIIKQSAGIATVSRIIKDVKKANKGTLSAKHTAKLSAAGVDQEFADRLLALHSKYGEKVRGVEIPNASLWDLEDADLGFDVGEFLLRFRQVLSREVDLQIVTPGAGDMPLSLRKSPLTDAVTNSLLGKPLTAEDIKTGNFDPAAQVGDRPGQFGKHSRIKREAAALYPHLGRLFGVYKSFIAGSWGRVLIPAIQNKDATELMGASTMIILGGIVKSLKDMSYDRPGPESLKGFLLEGFDQAGLGSWFMFANSQGEALLDVGLRPLLGMPRFEPSLRWQASSVFGASIGQLIRAGRLVGDVGGAAMGDDFSSSSMTNAIRLVPGQSLFYLRLQKLFGLEEGYNTLFGNEAAVGAN